MPAPERCCPRPGVGGPAASPATLDAVESVRQAARAATTCDGAAALGDRVAKLTAAPPHPCSRDGQDDAWAAIVEGIATKARELGHTCTADAFLDPRRHFEQIASDADYLWMCLQPPP